MAESKMTNVRLKAEEVAKVDAVSSSMGMSRSDFIRKALTEALAKYAGDETPVTGVRVRGKEKPKTGSTYPHSTCPKGPQCSWVKAPTGVKICTTCKIKRA